MPYNELDPAYGNMLPPSQFETPTEGMKRIEEAMAQPPERPNTQRGRLAAGAGRTVEGYNARLGAQGPVGAGLIVAADPVTGQPVMVGGTAQAGPLSYAVNKPTFRGAQPSHTVGIGGTPFDADTYFGATVQQSPGQGRGYGLNVSGNDEDSGAGWNAYGSYNPATKGLNVGGGYQTPFAAGGSVRPVVGHETAAGVPVSLEEHKGETRHRAHSGDSKMAADYGYISNAHKDADGAKLDAYVGPHKDSDKVFVVNQQHPHTKKFNEHKVLLGYHDRSHALRDFAHSFADGQGHQRIHSVIEMTADQLKDWVKKSHTAPLKKAEGGPVYDVMGNVSVGDNTDYRDVPGYGAVEAASQGMGEVGGAIGRDLMRVGEGLKKSAMLPGEVLSGERQIDPSNISDEDISDVLGLAGFAAPGAMAHGPVAAGETVLGSGPLLTTTKIAPGRKMTLADVRREFDPHAGTNMAPDEVERLVDAYGRVASPVSEHPDFAARGREIADTYITKGGSEFGGRSFFNHKPSVPLEELGRAAEPVPYTHEPKAVVEKSWQDVGRERKDSPLISLGGDLSDLVRLRGYGPKDNLRALANATDIHAGFDYMLEPNLNSVWSNNPEHAAMLEKQVLAQKDIQRAVQKDLPVMAVANPMGPKAIDSAKNMMDLYLNAVEASPIQKVHLDEVATNIREGKFGGSPAEKAKLKEKLGDFPGFDDMDKARAFLLDNPDVAGTTRAAIIKGLEKADLVKKGFPEVGQLRVAASSPKFMMAPGNTMGGRMVELDPRMFHQAEANRYFDHYTYGGDTPGTYYADVPLVQRQYGAPDATDQLMAKYNVWRPGATKSAPPKAPISVHPFSTDQAGRDTWRKMFEEQRMVQPINDRMIESIGRGVARRSSYGFAKGGEVEGAAPEAAPVPASAVAAVRNTAHDIAKIAHKDRLDQRHLAYLLKAASGSLMPPARAMEFAGQIMTGDVDALVARFDAYPPSARTFARLNEMLGGKHEFMGKGHMGKEMQRMKGVDALQRTKEAAAGAMDSDVVRSRPIMAKALKRLSKRI